MFTSDETEKKKNPILKAWCLTRIFFLWTIDIYRLGHKRDLNENDIYAPLDEHSSEKVGEKFTKLWNEELKRKKPSLIGAFLRGYGFRVIAVSTMFSLSEASLKILLPICLGGLVSYFVPGQTEISRDDAFMYAGTISVVTLLIAIIFHPCIFYIIHSGIKLQVGCLTLLYQKVLKFSKSTVFDGMNGQVINLMSNDLSKIEMGLVFHHDLWKGPFEALIMGYLIYTEIGIAGVFGMIFLISFIPLQVWVAKKSASYHLKASKRTDTRIKFMNEILQAIQVIKMYAWEKSFASIVDKIRRKEMGSIRGAAYGRATLFSFTVISRIAIFLSFTSYIYYGEVLTARKVFMVSSYFMTLSSSMVFFWPMAITEVLDALISLKRIESFLLQPEKKQTAIKENGEEKKTNLHISNKQLNGFSKSEATELLPKNTRLHNEAVTDSGVSINNLTAIWSVDEGHIGLFSINLEIEPTKLCTIVGPVGSGKTTLLNVILGELQSDSGSISINGSLSFASQEPWLFVGTIKQNIVFIEEFDETRYAEVCRVCALERDFELLPFGDMTMVDERGANLSGGQRARINLARAVYRKADIYLLDDPLSAVDVKVGKHIYIQCIKRYLKKNCVVLVTHQIQYLKRSEHIVLLSNGRIDAQGNFEYIKSKKPNLINQMTAPADNKDSICEELVVDQTSISSFKHDEVSKEVLTKGTVSIRTYKTYLTAVGSIITVIFVLSWLILSALMMTGVDYFMAKWCNWEEIIVATNSSILTNTTTTNSSIITNHTSGNPMQFLFENTMDESTIRHQYIISYLILVVIMCYFVIHRTFAFFKMCITISINLHDRLFRGVSRAMMLFFNKNQSGWVLNRFSKDIGAIDKTLPNTLMESIICLLEMVCMALIVCVVNPWLLIPTGVIAIILYALRKEYLITSRSLNRLQAISRSPIYAHTNTTLQGLSTIKSSRAERVLMEQFNRYVNNNTASIFLFKAINRTFAQWVDIVSAIYVVCITFSCLLIFSGERLGGDVGLIISKAILLVGMLQWGLRQSAELENHMISVERIQEYTKLEPEASLETLPANLPQREWPEFGEIVFNNVSLRYSIDKEYVLKGLNFTINPKEKIGIVGRTGAGKSSIIQALFRLSEPEGKIEIDGINTHTLGLHDLRKKISIIPQDPILFSGTMRNNLDPMLEKSDDELWSALEQVQLKQPVSKLAGGLDSKMSDGGSNFSMGQRQLVCLARAILRNNKILILDEATANVDPETDKLIQTTIREKFVDCTVLTIAHRLHTVIDSDRILVMDSGRAMEFDAPKVLLKKSDSLYRKMFDEADMGLYPVL